MNTQQMHTQKINAELQDIRIEVARLRALAQRPRGAGSGRLESYIEQLDDKRKALASRVASLDGTDKESMNDVMRGLKEAQDRLSIAREAAKARFH